MRYDLVSFDLDGTLVDTACEIAEAANRALESNGMPRRAPAEIALLIGAGTAELISRLFDAVLLEQPSLAHSVRRDAVLASMDHHYAATTGSSARPYDGARDALARLQAAGIRLACVTNKEQRHARRVLEVTGLDEWFDLVVGGDTLPQKKPHASVLEHVVRTLDSSVRRCAHVGDSAIDVAAARNAGVAAWAVPYGYNAGVPVADARPDRLFQNLLQVAEHVLHGAEHATA